MYATAGAPVERASAVDRPDVVGHSAAVSRTNALIVEVRVSLSGPASVFVEYDNPLAGRYRTRLGAAATEHIIPIVRLRPETTYDYTVFTVDGAERSDAARGPGGSFTTGALPKPLAAIFTTATGRSSQPLILSDHRSQDMSDSYLVFWDEVGALVWYLRVKNTGPVVRRQGQENFLFAPVENGLRQFTPLGKVTDLAGVLLAEMHHDLVPLEGGRILFPMASGCMIVGKRELRRAVDCERQLVVIRDAFDSGGAEQRRLILYDHLAIWHSATGRIEEVWDPAEAFDILDPAQHWEPARRGVQRWTHLNSVSQGVHGNFLLSFRHRSQVASLTSDYEIEWLLHGPESDYEFPDPTDRFYGQHTATQLANGNVLLFDNGRRRPDAEGGKYSRALELRLDDAMGTAVKVWEYRPSPDIYAHAGSSAYRLDSGNTLVNFSVTHQDLVYAPLVVVEADANGDEVFRIETVQLHQRPSRYRAQGGIEAIYGETMLRPPAEFVQRPPPVRRHYERMRRVAASTFDLYLDDGYLVYAKAPCSVEDIERPFFLHVRPQKPYMLAEDRREVGFDNLDSSFFWSGLRWPGGCHVEVRLPAYAIDYIATGQGVAEGGGGGWRVDIPWVPQQ